MIDVVVAAYNEDVSWIKELLGKDDIMIHIYYKGGTNLLSDICKSDEYTNLIEISLPNQGREAGTYLYHITKYYDSISQWTVFLQGNPMAHISVYDNTKSMYDLIKDICIEESKKELDTSNPYFKYFHSIPFENASYEYMYQNIPIVFKYHQLFEGQKPNTWKFPAGAQFAVHKDAIIHRPLSFYKELYTQVINMANAAGGGDVLYNDLLYTNDNERSSRCDAWTLECLWPHIFDPSIKHHAIPSLS